MANLYPETIKPIGPYHVRLERFTNLTELKPSGVVFSRQGREQELLRATLIYPRHLVANFATLYQFHAQMRGRNGRFVFTDFHGWNDSPVGIPWYLVYVGIGTGAATAFDLPSKSATSRTLYVNGVAKTEAAYSATRARSGTTVTLVTQSAHGFSTSDSVTITGLGGSNFNGTFSITVVNPTTFTYTSGSGTVTTTPDTGGICMMPARWYFTSAGASDSSGRDKATLGTAPTAGHILRFDFRGRLSRPNCFFTEDFYDFESFSAGLTRTGISIWQAAI